MAIVVTLKKIFNEQDVEAKSLAAKIDLSEVNLSRIKNGKIKAIRFSTLDALCRELNCQPGDILKYVPDDETPSS